jgi:spermidine synthase
MKRLATVLLAAVLPALPFVPAALAQPPAPAATASAAAPTPIVIFDKASAYGRVFVVEEGRRRMLRFDDVNGVDQSAMSLDDPASIPMEYVRYAALGLLFVPKLERLMMIGLGGGSFTGLIHRALPAVRIDAIEIDPVVVEAARRYFGLVEDENYRVHIADGAAFVRESKMRYDLILADAGVADGIPEHHTTDPFFSALRERLTPDGVLVVNLGLDERANAIIAQRIKAAFGADACTGVSTPVDANTLVFASRRPPAPQAAQLRARAVAIDGRRLLPYELTPLAAQLGRCP